MWFEFISKPMSFSRKSWHRWLLRISYGWKTCVFTIDASRAQYPGNYAMFLFIQVSTFVWCNIRGSCLQCACMCERAVRKMALCLFDSGSLIGFCSLYWNLETCTLENVGQRWFLSWTRFREFLTTWSFKIFTDNSTNSLCVTSIRSMDSTLKALQVRSMVTISNSLSLAARDHDSCSPISRAAFRQGGFSD